ncbi:LIM/homeobox protein Lhx2 [Branchiostoma belcheri]|nr:LIM/homeobox protein Lhx2 [Branchiostoma belcheri]
MASRALSNSPRPKHSWEQVGNRLGTGREQVGNRSGARLGTGREQVGSKFGCGWLVFGKVGYCLAAPATCLTIFKTFGNRQELGLWLAGGWLVFGMHEAGFELGTSWFRAKRSVVTPGVVMVKAVFFDTEIGLKVRKTARVPSVHGCGEESRWAGLCARRGRTEGSNLFTNTYSSTLQEFPEHDLIPRRGPDLAAPACGPGGARCVHAPPNNYLSYPCRQAESYRVAYGNPRIVTPRKLRSPCGGYTATTPRETPPSHGVLFIQKLAFRTGPGIFRRLSSDDAVLQKSPGLSRVSARENGCNCAGEPCEVQVSSTALDDFLLQDITTLPTGCSSGASAEHGRAMPVVHPEDKPGVCAGCGGRIVDRYYLLAVDKQWHLHCLKCCECKLRLESELTCFAKDGSIYCKQDYYRRFSVKRCARCHLGISASEMVMRARDLVFHLNCFMCETCNRPLTTGDQFGMRGDTVYCRYDYETLVHGEASHLPLGAACSPPQTPTSPTGAQFYNGVGAIHKGRPRKRKSPEPNGYIQGEFTFSLVVSYRKITATLSPTLCCGRLSTFLARLVPDLISVGPARCASGCLCFFPATSPARIKSINFTANHARPTPEHQPPWRNLPNDFNILKQSAGAAVADLAAEHQPTTADLAPDLLPTMKLHIAESPGGGGEPGCQEENNRTDDDSISANLPVTSDTSAR